jgi:thymidylate synthase ThyX
MLAEHPVDAVVTPSTFPPRRVYSVVGVPPEVQAYAMAKYSRSGQGMLESIQELSQQKAEQFLNTFYFQYGHRSIADLAHLVFGVEQISILAAIALVDEPVWDGQERSTRYQPFQKTGWYTPPSLAGTPAERTYDQTARSLFAAYEDLTQRLTEHLVGSVPRPEGLSEGSFRRTLRARAFDVARALLPLATHTSVGQVVSARTVERQVSRLLTSRFPEVQAIGGDLKEACQRAAEAPLTGSVLEKQPEMADVLRPRAAPTLVKYADASAYEQQASVDLAQAASAYLGPIGPADASQAVELAPIVSDPLVDVAATLLYRHDPVGHSYAQSVRAVADLTGAQRQEVLDISLRHRGRYDDLLREHQAGYALTFDVLMDVGSFRDLHRHRRCVQVPQAFTFGHGFDRPEEVFQAGLGAAVAYDVLEEGLGDLYAETLLKAEQAAGQVATADPLAAPYLMPLAYRTRCLFKMDWAQAVYIVEQRTAPAGHFSYRRVAWAMYEALRARYPALAAPIRATNPHESFDLLDR